MRRRDKHRRISLNYNLSWLTVQIAASLQERSTGSTHYYGCANGPNFRLIRSLGGPVDKEGLMDSVSPRSTFAAILRWAAGLTALSLVVYVPYRYAVRPPGFEDFLGTAYALLFPLSLLLAAGTLWVASRPAAVSGLASAPSGGRWALGVYGGLWVAMGLMCVPSLTALAEVSPAKGLFSTIHMSAQHVFLGFGAVIAAWRPAFVRDLLTGVDDPVASGFDVDSRVTAES